MKRLFALVLCLLPLWVAAQSGSPSVPATLPFANLTIRFSSGGQRAVQQKVDALRSHPASFQARVLLADAYFPIIDRVFQEEAVPLDFRYLALQESGLQGDAQSIHDAVGYWQFKREAATDFNLLMNDQVDERKHIVTASHAAAKYFKRSHNAFHNWLDVLLSYNLGIGGTKPYTLPTDAAATEMEVTERSHPYIITFLAHKIAFEQAVGLNGNPALALQEFPAAAGQPLAAMAASFQTTPEELAKHNRWLLAEAVPSDKAYTVLVPVTDPAQVAALAAQQPVASTAPTLAQPTPDPRHPGFVLINGLRAVVALPGETKETLAQRTDLKLRRFMRYNDLYAFDNVVAGQPYFVQKKRDKAAVEYHVAQPNESITTISQQYGIRVRSILSKNRMARNEELRPGRVLWLQHTRPRDVPVEYKTVQNEAALAAFARPTRATQAAPGPAPVPSTKTFPPTTQPTAPAPAHVVAAAPADTAAMLNDEVATTGVADTAAMPAVSATPAPAPASAPRSVYQPAPARPTAPASAANNAPAPATAATEASSAAPAAAPYPMMQAPATPAPLPPNGLHTVRTKETLYGIARLYHISPRDLEAWNGLPLNPSLKIGQQLRVTPPEEASDLQPKTAPTQTAPTPPAAKTPIAPAAAPTTKPQPATPTTVQHTVQAGESMYGISRKYGVTIKQILEWNNKPDFNVRPGEVLTITPAK
ncbi:LysM peptidoglycan-binding domain-containing protein [Hymenobacter aerilatus]|uniref:LysM peptidoglycan-binding domain-containing protein n=1 Tax=Hymenobacter aerilatus TaxID=2932251 RepID=A0A8T9STS9_9BACT|nr:LysM peptidoglycan-binding domain-containing protein [Hymenobacter aerilatus]UOR05572.1 LysM peptidoglycan-binding domain-containing protein [Hymenobacter aerilatus]